MASRLSQQERAAARRGGARQTAPRGDATLPGKLKEAAVRLFREGGYAGVTVDDIVREVGVTKGGFYHYFESKGELLFALHNEYVTYSVDQYRRVFAEAGDPAAQLDGFVREAFRQIHEFGGHVQVLFDERRFIDADRAEEIEAKKDELRRMLVAVLDDGIAQGIFRPMSSQACALAVFGMCMWGYQWYRRDGALTHEELAGLFVELLHRGVDA